MFHSFKDTREKLVYLESSKEGIDQPINVSWLIRTLKETNEKAERYEKALKEIADSNEDTPFARHIILFARRNLDA